MDGGKLAGLRWIVAAVFASILLGIVAVWVPAAVKKIGLFSILIGTVSAWITLKIAQSLQLKVTLLLSIAIVSLAGLTEAGRIAETFRLARNFHEQSLKNELANSPLAAMALNGQPAAEMGFTTVDFMKYRYAIFGQSLAVPVYWALLLTEIGIAIAGAGTMIYLQLRQDGSTKIENQEVKPET